jgi:uncharacterized membrane protein YhaH (DUF805 family)
MKWYLKVLQNYVNFGGRARRKEYWNFVLFNAIFVFALAFVSELTQSFLLYLLYCLAVTIPAIAVGVRRMHDVNKSGWYILFPFYNLILACREGTRGENEYGFDPKTEMPGFDFDQTNPTGLT